MKKSFRLLATDWAPRRQPIGQFGSLDVQAEQPVTSNVRRSSRTPWP